MSSENGLAQHYEAVLSHLRHIASVYTGEARFDDALRILRYAEQIVKEADVAQADRARVLTQLGTTLTEHASFATGAFDEALPVLHEAVETAEVCGNEQALVEALNALGMAHYRHIMSTGVNNFEQPAGYFDRALATAKAAGYDHGAGVALLHQAYVAERQQRYDDAVALFTHVRTLAEQHDWPQELAETWRHLCLGHWRANEWTEAEQCFEQALAVLEKEGKKATLPFAHLSLGETLAAQGKLAEAMQQYQTAYNDAQATGNRRAALQTAFSIGEVHKKQGDRTQARRWYEQARAQAETMQFTLGVTMCEAKLQYLDASEKDV